MVYSFFQRFSGGTYFKFVGGAVPLPRGRDRVNRWSLCVPKGEMSRRLDSFRHIIPCTHVTTTLYSFDLLVRLGINLQTRWNYFPCTNHSSSVLIFCTNHFFHLVPQFFSPCKFYLFILWLYIVHIYFNCLIYVMLCIKTTTKFSHEASQATHLKENYFWLNFQS